MVADAITSRNKKQSTVAGRLAEVSYATVPRVQDAIVNAGFKLFPDSRAAKKPEPDGDAEADARGGQRRAEGVRAGDARRALVRPDGRGDGDRPPQALGLGARSRAQPRARAARGDGADGPRAARVRRRRASRSRCRSSAVELPAPRVSPPARARADLRGRPALAHHARARQGLPRRRARLPRGLRESAGPRRAAPRRGRGRGGAGVVLRTRASPRSRTAAARRSCGGDRAAAAARVPGSRLDRPRRARPGARGRRGLARGADPGRRARAGARGSAARARADAALLPAVVRVLDARRLDRNPRRRPLRDASSRTSTTWSSRCGRSPRPATGRAGGCPARARARARTGC